MAQQDIKQIRGASQGSILFLGTNSVVSEDFNNLNWNQSSNILYVNGNLQIVDGNQQAGYVLTSDSNGLATWLQSTGATGPTGPTGPSGGTLTPLSDIMAIGNTASSNLDMNDFDIINIQSLQFTGFSITGMTGSTNVLTLDKTLGDSMKMEYHVINSIGYKRTGTLMIVWDLIGSEFTDYSSEDLNGLTNDLEFTTSISGSDLLVTAIITGDTWEIKYTYSIM